MRHCMRRKSFQSTHPVRGATTSTVRPYARVEISIHAPRAGCDQIRRKTRSSTIHFNPRTPCGVRHCINGAPSCVRTISIHAPRAGCDDMHEEYREREENFNPRTPCGVRRRETSHQFQRRFISIHAPRAGCDQRRGQRAQIRRNISIHAPRAGCDQTAAAWIRLTINFNPRTPCGVRLLRIVCFMPNSRFQSTHPVQGATTSRSWMRDRTRYFNPRTPCGVRPASTRRRANLTRHFNPRTPCGVRLFNIIDGITIFDISIHAPRAGCDNQPRLVTIKLIRFQSTHPVRGATLILQIFCKM